MRIAKVIIIGTVCATMVALSGCYAHQKRKLPLVKQAYHDITARNNAYFNADLKMGSVQQNMRAAHVDDYTKVLPIYTDRNPDLATSYSTDLDMVIKKASTDIKEHEPSIYTDNNYMLVAIGYYLKGDFETALETFQYVNTEFKEKPNKKKSSKKKKKTSSSKSKSSSKSSSSKKKKGKPMTAAQLKAQQNLEMEEKMKKIEEGGALETDKDVNEEYEKDPLWWVKHQPMRPDAKIWMVDTYTALKKYKEASAVLTLIDADRQFPHWLRDDLEIARANHFLQKGDYEKAIQPLIWLTTHLKGKRKKVRYNYILAQIYQMRGDKVLAVDYYKQVLKGKPDYRMAFNAKISMAKIAAQDNTMDQKDIARLLRKMLKENKNSDFYDQIYYALAELSLKDGKKDEAIAYLEKSIEVSTTNTGQKALSYLKLADLHFDKQEYVEAQPPYEAAVGLLSNEDPRYPDIMGRSEVLKRLVAQVNTIEEQDSMFKLVSLSEVDKMKLIEDELKRLEDDFKKKQDQKNQPIEAIGNQPTPTNNSPSNGNSSGDWYFYNTGLKSSGYNEFIKRWGNRKLEDNWRRSDKTAAFADNPSDTAKTDVAAPPADEFDYYGEKQKLVAQMPGAADATAINGKMVEAYFSLANIYRYDLYNLSKAAETYEELLKRVPGNKYEVEALYNLYLIYDKLGNPAKSEKYKNELLTKYPDSKPSKIIKDPKFLEASNQLKVEVDAHYLATFDLYRQNRLEEALTQIQYADSLYASRNHLQPKYDLLEAFIIGQVADLGEYKKALQDIVVKYPNDDVKIKAQEILSYIEKSEDVVIKKENNMLRYEYNDQARHFFMIVVKDSTLRLTDVSTALAQYNDVNRSLESLKIDPLVLPDGSNLLLVKSFETLDKARIYLNAINQSGALAKFRPEALSLMIISDINFNKIIINKEAGTYFDYYNLKYPK
ncbi:hypothetical protein BH09BAC1_BH09BAC1_10090 [soil metagenome]